MKIFMLVPKTAPPPQPSAKTTVTPMRYAPPAKIPTKVWYALRTVPQALIRQELSITHALHVPAEPLPVCGIKTNVNCGPIAPLVSIYLPTARAALTVYVVAAGLGNFPHLTTPIPVRTGQVA